MNKRVKVIIICTIIVTLISITIFFISNLNKHKENQNLSDTNSMVIEETNSINNTIETDETIDVEENVLVEETVTPNVEETVTSSQTTQSTKPNNNNTSSSSSTNNNTQKPTTPSVQNNQPETPTPPPEPPVVTPPPVACNHSGLWFNSVSEAESYFYKEVATWEQRHKNNKVTYQEYTQNCPDRCDTMSCSICGKYLLTMYYGN